MSLFVWIYVFALIALSNVFGCRKEFSKEYFYFWYNCTISEASNFRYKEVREDLSKIWEIVACYSSTS
ncbi:hypothetical protein ANCCAN_05590 [Ancylostoma caninum]|uniref:Uncharacterized protein n=1 Tax=Ancylostoma caninum TaxID=29170 RepID=A0A368GVB8_ANCCA|nr:hypothetical protein ANCCAN_05590 [Ancylostoma caninum]